MRQRKEARIMEAGRKRDEIDEMIRLELLEYLKDLPVDGEEEGWRRIQEELYSSPRRSAVRTKHRLLATAAIVAAAILVLFQASSVRAWGRDFLRSQLVKMPGPWRNIVGVFIPHSLEERTDTTDPAKQMKAFFSTISFDPLVIGKDAGEWSLTGVGVETKETGTRVALEYKDARGNTLALKEDSVLGPRGSAVLYDADDTVVTEVTIRGNAISILYHKSGQVNAWWIEQGLGLYLSGRCSTDAAVDFIQRLVVYPGGR